MQILNLKSKILNHRRGFVFVEILIAVALISIVFITLLGIVFSTVSLSTSLRTKSRADSLIKEELEAVRAFRDGTTWADFTNIIFGDYYYFTLVNNQWTRNLGTETVGNFTRNVVFDQVYRDANGDVQPPEALPLPPPPPDQDTVKVTATVSWSDQTMQTTTYLTNWQNK